MIYKCCLCGTAYNSESAAVKCVNRCGRAMHQKGVFQTKNAPYIEGTTEVIYNGEQSADLKSLCKAAVDRLGGAKRNFFIEQFNKWDSMSEVEQKQLYDMVSMIGG